MKSEREQLGLVIVDYLQLMSGRGRFENRNQEVSALSRGLKLLAKELNVPMMVLSQLSRAVETRQGDHRPQLSDFANRDRSSRTPTWWASFSAKKSTIATAKI